jgi:hypothetical protein
VNAQGNTEQASAKGNDDTDMVYDSHGGEVLNVGEWLQNVAHEELLENRKRALDNLYKESKGCDKECTILQTEFNLLIPKGRNGWVVRH